MSRFALFALSLLAGVPALATARFPCQPRPQCPPCPVTVPPCDLLTPSLNLHPGSPFTPPRTAGTPKWVMWVSERQSDGSYKWKKGDEYADCPTARTDAPNKCPNCQELKCGDAADANKYVICLDPHNPNMVVPISAICPDMQPTPQPGPTPGPCPVPCPPVMYAHGAVSVCAPQPCQPACQPRRGLFSRLCR